VNDDEFNEMDDSSFGNLKTYGRFTYLKYLLYILIYHKFMTTHFFVSFTIETNKII